MITGQEYRFVAVSPCLRGPLSGFGRTSCTLASLFRSGLAPLSHKLFTSLVICFCQSLRFNDSGAPPKDRTRLSVVVPDEKATAKDERQDNTDNGDNVVGLDHLVKYARL